VSDAELLEHGDAALRSCLAVLDTLTAAADAKPTPCTEYTVAGVREHLEGSMDLLGRAAGAEPAPEAADVATRARAALAAWRARGLSGTVPIGSRTLPATQAYAILPLELAVHGWDLAAATGLPYTLPDDTANYLLEQSALLITPERRGRGFAAAVPVASDAPVLERLIAFTGRDPRYT
jgi:uncharacterized protein (TIGR03086 family)